MVLLDDPAIAELNETYLGRKGPTNVLAFSMREGPYSDVQPGLLGDVVISVDTARREAEEAGVSFEERLDFLLIHGILHLFGYDHEGDDDQARRMEDKSEELAAVLRSLG